VKSYLLSWLARKHATTSVEEFVRAEAPFWLVWEAGPWRPPTRTRETILARPGLPKLEAGESLAIQLAARDGGAAVTLGRDASNDLVVDDATLSRAHMRFERGADGRWTVRDLGSSNGTRVDGARALAAAPLQPGSRIDAGAVALTFYDAAGLLMRLHAG
jgi:pSer/pThr/pTyr-binding forkhead associated (FHA) protein